METNLPLSAYECRLNERFFKIDQGILISLDKIDSVGLTFNHVTMINGKQAFLSRSRKRAFKEQLEMLMNDPKTYQVKITNSPLS